MQFHEKAALGCVALFLSLAVGGLFWAAAHDASAADAEDAAPAPAPAPISAGVELYGPVSLDRITEGDNAGLERPDCGRAEVSRILFRGVGGWRQFQRSRLVPAEDVHSSCTGKTFDATHTLVHLAYVGQRGTLAWSDRHFYRYAGTLAQFESAVDAER